MHLKILKSSARILVRLVASVMFQLLRSSLKSSLAILSRRGKKRWSSNTKSGAASREIDRITCNSKINQQTTPTICTWLVHSKKQVSNYSYKIESERPSIVYQRDTIWWPYHEFHVVSDMCSVIQYQMT